MRFLSGMTLALFAAVLPQDHARAAAVTFDVASELTFEIPQGWVACDPETSAKLQGPAPSGRMGALCAAFDDTGGARMVGTPDGSFALSFSINGPAQLPPEYLHSVTAEKVSAMSAALCQATLKNSSGGMPCAFELENVAGRPALVGHLHTADGQFDIGRMVDIPGRTRSVTFAFMAFPASADSNSRMDAILASIRDPEKAAQH